MHNRYLSLFFDRSIRIYKSKQYFQMQEQNSEISQEMSQDCYFDDSMTPKSQLTRGNTPTRENTPELGPTAILP